MAHDLLLYLCCSFTIAGTMGDLRDGHSLRLSKLMTEWSSFELKTITTIHNVGDSDAPSGAKVTNHYIETAMSLRYADQLVENSEGVTQRATSFSDGSRQAQLVYGPSKETDFIEGIAITKNKNFMGEDELGLSAWPLPFGYYFAGRKPLYEAILTSELLCTRKLLGRDCDVFSLGPVLWSDKLQILIYCLDIETSVPLGVSSYRDQQSLSSNLPLWTWTASSFDKIDNQHAVLKSKLIAFNATGSTRAERLINVENIHFNKTFSKSSFWPSYRPGIKIYDHINKKEFVVARSQGQATLPASGKTLPSNANTSAEPLRAISSNSWFSPLSLGLLITGLTALGIGICSYAYKRTL
jgi:hypothetical protein